MGALREHDVGVARAAHSYEQLRLAIEAAPTGILMVDALGSIVLVNAQLEALFGYTRVDLLGQSVDLLVPERFRFAHASHRSHFLADPQARTMGSGRDLRGRRKDGSELSIEIGLTSLQTPEGSFILCSVIDITERIQAAEYFSLAIEAAPTGMLMVNDRGLITFVNAQIETQFGYRREELLGRPAEMLVPERLRARHPPQRSFFMSGPDVDAIGAGRDLYGLRKDGTELPIEIGLNPLHTPKGSFVLSAIVDVTERKRAAELLAESLHEKETLLKEIHHRVKNNLQVVSSLLSLQSHHVADEQTREAFAQSQSRVHSIALVHEKLYQAADLSRISFTDYARELTDHLIHAQGGLQRGIRCIVRESDLQLAVDTCIACGLVVNELVTNSIKHAFVDRNKGSIFISFEKSAGRLALTVTDDGIGLPVNLDLTRVKTLGLDLVTTFAHRLRADVEVNRTNGTSFTLRFVER